jgi:uncharacterized protein
VIVLVTGASSGIGQAAARRLAREPGARMVLVARREERLHELAAEIGGATVVAVDLTGEAAPATVAERVESEHGRLDVLVNNAGASWPGTFADGGWQTVRRTMAIDFDAPVRLTERLLPLLRRSAPSAVVNVGSVAGRVARPGDGGYSAAKFALVGWSESLAHEERPHGIHVGMVQPGFVTTEGFPQRGLMRSPVTRRLVSRPEVVAEAIADVALRGRSERYTPRPYRAVAVLAGAAPWLVRAAIGRGAG